MKPSGQNKANPKGRPPARSGTGRKAVLWSIILLVIVVAAVVVVRRSQSSTAAPPPSGVSPGQSSATNTTATVAGTKPDFQKLKGRWLRPDGGYIIEIKKAEDSGKLDAAYFNPRPINVARAEASQEGAVTKVFVELRDVNYPGSTYTLTYLPERDLLVGIYFQALEQHSFEVYFERLK